MLQRGLQDAATTRSSADGVLTRISMGLNVAVCALSTAALLAWAAFGAGIHGPIG
jgi:hypothetical protein